MRRHAAGFDPHDVAAPGSRAVAGADDIEAGRRAVPRRAGLARGAPATSSTSPAPPGSRPRSSLGVSPRGATALMRTARAWAWLTGPRLRDPRRRQGARPGHPRPPAGAAARGRARGRRRQRRCSPRALGSVPGARAEASPMAITGRVPLLLLLGLVPVVLRPTVGTHVAVAARGARCWSASTWLLAPSPGRCSRVERPPVGPGAAGPDPPSTLVVGQRRRRRRTRCCVRDAWQPTAGATRQPAPAPARARRPRAADAPRCSPTRRGDLRALGRHRCAPAGRSAWPPGSAPATCRARSGRCRRSSRASTCPSRLARLRDLDGRSAVRVRGQGTEFDSLREYVRGDDVRSIDWRATRPQPHRRGAHLAARARPAGGAGARHLADVSAGPRRRRTPARLGDGRRAAARRARRPGRRPGRLRRRRPAGPRPPAAAPARATRRADPAGRDGRPASR